MLHDHFRPPLGRRRPWHGFHSAWAAAIAAQLNENLPAGWFASPNVQFGIEIDVSAVEEPDEELVPSGVGQGSGNGAGPQWSPPPAPVSIGFPPATDVVEVEVFSEESGLRLAGAVELVSPANKDRPANRRAFLSKCETLLRGGLGLVVIDVVTTRRFHLHRALLRRFERTTEDAGSAPLYAVAYHPVTRDSHPALDVWPHSLVVGEPLPDLPLYLHQGPCVRLDLDRTYARACADQRIG